MVAVENELIINIAGFLLKLNLRKSKGVNVRKMFTYHVKNTFKPFIVKYSASQLIDVEIDVMEREKIMGASRIIKNGKTYVTLYEKIGKKNITYYDLSAPQFQEVIRQFVFKGIYTKKGLIIHASSVVNGKNTDLFIAPSGGGKSTILKLIESHFVPFTDDAVLIRKEGVVYYCYQIPFADQFALVKDKIKRNRLNNIYFIHKAQYNKVIRMDNTEAAKRLLLSSIREKMMVKNTMLLCAEHKRFFDLYFSDSLDSKQLSTLLINNS